jgi:DNA polymerase I
VIRIKKEALFVIDGSYLLYRSFYAIKPLQNSSGIPTQATYGFCRAIKKLLDSFEPSHMVVVWDSKVKTFRHEMYAEYKATRQKPPSDLFIQKEYIVKFLEALGLAQITVDGYEGDDVIAALVHTHADRQVVLVCPDKDMLQLLAPHLLIFDPFKERVIDRASFTAEHGFTPEKIPFFYALLGDTSDNIPGVRGIGEKSAADLIKQFDSLDDMYANLEKITKDRTRTLIADQKESAYLSYKLFLLKPPALGLTLQDMQFDPAGWAKTLPLLRELEFSSLVKGIEKKITPSNPTTNLFGLAEGQSSLVTPTEQPTFEPQVKPFKMLLVNDDASFEALLTVLKNADIIALDTETTGASPLQDALVGMSFAVNTEETYYLPLAHLQGKQVDKAAALAALKPILENTKKSFVMHNAKFDDLVIGSAGILMPPVTFDTLIAASLLRGDGDKINLKELSLRILGEPMQKFKDVVGKKYKNFAQVPIEDGASYAAHDALQTLKIYHYLKASIEKEPTLKKLFYEIEMPFYSVLLHMERVGILLDADKIKATAHQVNQDITTLQEKILGAITHKHAVADFNLNSPRQIEVLLFDDLKLPVIKKSSTGHRSTDQEVLSELAKVHPIPGLILKYRELAKLVSTYLEPLTGFINPNTNRVHTSYSQTLVATGRLSSSEPNLQNIPTSEGYGMQIRDAFYAPTGKTFLSADYSQVELRILAHLSSDPTLISIFKNNKDIHQQTAAQLFDVPLDKVTHEQRQLGKRINFSIIYGMTPYGLAQDLGIKPSEAKMYIEKYFAQYPQVAAWMEETVEKSVEHGYTETLFGRRRYIKELHERNKTLFEAGKRMAINTPVQGTQAEIIKMAMINIDRILSEKKLGSRLILQIHDELIIEVPNDELAMVEKLIAHEMDTVVQWEVPLKVTMRSGKTWAEVTK